MKSNKRRFSYPERYAVWHCNGQRCWWCKQPLRLVEVTIDHVVPESLLYDEEKRQAVLTEYGLPRDFKINGYENWLPCHNHCNQRKGSSSPAFVPGNKAILDGLRERAHKAERIARSVTSNVAKDRVFKTVFAGLERQTITVRDLADWLEAFVHDPTKAGLPDDFIVLDSGYWIRRDQIVREGICRCERNTCVGCVDKVYCYFQASLSSWVVNTGLFWRCYDEVITCRRCSARHKRGHVGREDVCGRPYASQEAQSD
jgi:hypothetical protein